MKPNRELAQLAEYADDGVNCGLGVFAKPKSTKRVPSNPERYRDKPDRKTIPLIRVGADYQATLPNYIGPYYNTS